VNSCIAPTIIPPDLLMAAYRSGIFPMSDSRDDPEIFWVEPRHRAILPLDGFYCSHSLARTLRRGKMRVTCNQAFAQVMEECAAPRPSEGGESWISHRIAASYLHLHQLGHAHSIECWQDDRLVGGLYGVQFDRVFCGESMFSRVSDSSKVALAWLVASLQRCGSELLDCQFLTDHLASLGALEISQSHYLRLLSIAQRPYSAASAGVGERAGGDAAGVADDGAAGASGEAAADAFAAGTLALPEGFAAVLGDAEAAGLASSPGNFIAQSLTQTS